MRVLTYVDDWTLMTLDTSVAFKQLDLVLSFASLTDLTIDRAKTFGWSTCPEMRASMRKEGWTVKRQARSLGAHLAFSRQRTNNVFQNRLRDLDDLWPKLAKSTARYLTQVSALRTVAWPRGLFVVSSVAVGKSVWLTLRRKAVHALSMRKPGVNPTILLGLVEPDADPEALAVLHTHFVTPESLSWSLSGPLMCFRVKTQMYVPLPMLWQALCANGFSSWVGLFDLLVTSLTFSGPCLRPQSTMPSLFCGLISHGLHGLQLRFLTGWTFEAWSGLI